MNTEEQLIEEALYACYCNMNASHRIPLEKVIQILKAYHAIYTQELHKDKARLDYLNSKFKEANAWLSVYCSGYPPYDIRQAIDAKINKENLTYKIIMSPEWSEKYRDARWARKRNKILERDDYTCMECGATKNLQVHHVYYERGVEIWDSKDELLITLCKDCHDFRGEVENTIKERFAILLARSRLNDTSTIRPGLASHISSLSLTLLDAIKNEDCKELIIVPMSRLKEISSTAYKYFFKWLKSEYIKREKSNT